MRPFREVGLQEREICPIVFDDDKFAVEDRTHVDIERVNDRPEPARPAGQNFEMLDAILSRTALHCAFRWTDALLKRISCLYSPAVAASATSIRRRLQWDQ